MLSRSCWALDINWQSALVDKMSRSWWDSLVDKMSTSWRTNEVTLLANQALVDNLSRSSKRQERFADNRAPLPGRVVGRGDWRSVRSPSQALGRRMVPPIRRVLELRRDPTGSPDARKVRGGPAAARRGRRGASRPANKPPKSPRRDTLLFSMDASFEKTGCGCQNRRHDGRRSVGRRGNGCGAKAMVPLLAREVVKMFQAVAPLRTSHGTDWCI
jgi:hypothetical protein